MTDEERAQAPEPNPGSNLGSEPGAATRLDPEPDPAAQPADPELLPMDFSTFILSLCTSAMVHLGEAPDPDGQSRSDFVLAKQTIDIVAMLQSKTAGNLSGEESRLLSELLYDLRMRYVAAAG